MMDEEIYLILLHSPFETSKMCAMAFKRKEVKE